MDLKEHWERVYATRAPTEVSWFQPHATLSLRLIKEAGLDPSAAIIDCGAGVSTLVDDLLRAGFGNLTVLDLSATALAAAAARLGKLAARVTWIEADVLEAQLPTQAYAVWHDRAVFHFLATDAERGAYVRAVEQAIRPGGLLIVATFAEDGPARCSGLPVTRYSVDELQRWFGRGFKLLGHVRESHRTPSGATQQFLYCHWRRIAPLVIEDQSSERDVAAAADHIRDCSGDVVFTGVATLRPHPRQIECIVTEAVPVAPRCENEYAVIAENAARALAASPLGACLPDRPLKWIVVEGVGMHAVEVWRAP
jgi:2-polyprenyl-3-methyl-5-hydroxy-6-metoxy-1,4-benzoquinol methylase